MKSYFVCTCLPVLDYLDKNSLLCFRGVSKKMRKRVRRVVKRRRVFLDEFDEKVLCLSDSVYLSSVRESYPCPEEPFKAVVDYLVTNQAELALIKGICSSLQCSLQLDSVLAPTEFEKVHLLAVSDETVGNYQSVKARRVTNLTLKRLKNEEIQRILGSITVVNKMTILHSEAIQLISLQFLTELYLEDSSISAKLVFPRLKSLQSTSCRGLNHIVCPNLRELEIDGDPISAEICEWIGNLNKLAVFKISAKYNSKLFSCFTSSLRHFQDFSGSKINIGNLNLNKKFPNLRSFEAETLTVELESISSLKLRYLNAKLIGKFEGILQFRPREMVIHSDNWQICTNHKEILEDCLEISVYTDKFDFGNLPNGLKCLVLGKFDLESIILTRFDCE